jgi:hypothetical protein
MKTITARTGACALLLSAALAAQVSPRPFVRAEGPAALIPAVGTIVPSDRQLQVDGELIGLGPRTIRGLRFRRDGLTRYPNPAFRIVVDVWVSHAATLPGAPNAIFDRNHGADRLHVVRGQEIAIPATTASVLTEPFAINLPFQTPFAYDGVRPLCWDVCVSQTTNNVALVGDAVAGAQPNPQPPGLQFGVGCRATGIANPALLVGAGGTQWQNPSPSLSLAYQAGWLPANSSAFLILDLVRLQPPLPMSPTCTLYLAPAVVAPLVTQANGTASISLPSLALSPAHNGLDVFAQVVAADVLATPIGLVLSNAVQHNIVAPFGAPAVGSVRAFAQLGCPANGVAAAGLCSVVEYY